MSPWRPPPGAGALARRLAALGAAVSLVGFARLFADADSGEAHNEVHNHHQDHKLRNQIQQQQSFQDWWHDYWSRQPFPSGYTQSSITMLACLITTIIFLIVVGNLLVVVAIFTEKSLKPTQNWFIASLAVSDMMLGLVVMPFSLARELMGFWIFGQLWCDIHEAVDVLLTTASINTLCLISLDRYWSITQAVNYLKKRTPRRGAFMIAFVWVFSAAVSLPPLFGWKKQNTSGNIDLLSGAQTTTSGDYPSLLSNVTPTGNRNQFDVQPATSASSDTELMSLFGDDTPPSVPPPPKAPEYPTCQLSDDVGYVLYSALGSFYIPCAVMVFTYIKIFLAARSRARRTINKQSTQTAASGALAGAKRPKGLGSSAPKALKVPASAVAPPDDSLGSDAFEASTVMPLPAQSSLRHPRHSHGHRQSHPRGSLGCDTENNGPLPGGANSNNQSNQANIVMKGKIVILERKKSMATSSLAPLDFRLAPTDDQTKAAATKSKSHENASHAQPIAAKGQMQTTSLAQTKSLSQQDTDGDSSSVVTILQPNSSEVMQATHFNFTSATAEPLSAVSGSEMTSTHHDITTQRVLTSGVELPVDVDGDRKAAVLLETFRQMAESRESSPLTCVSTGERDTSDKTGKGAEQLIVNLEHEHERRIVIDIASSADATDNGASGDQIKSTMTSSYIPISNRDKDTELGANATNETCFMTIEEDSDVLDAQTGRTVVVLPATRYPVAPPKSRRALAKVSGSTSSCHSAVCRRRRPHHRASAAHHQHHHQHHGSADEPGSTCLATNSTSSYCSSTSQTIDDDDDNDVNDNNDNDNDNRHNRGHDNATNRLHDHNIDRDDDDSDIDELDDDDEEDDDMLTDECNGCPYGPYDDDEECDESPCRRECSECRRLTRGSTCCRYSSQPSVASESPRRPRTSSPNVKPKRYATPGSHRRHFDDLEAESDGGHVIPDEANHDDALDVDDDDDDDDEEEEDLERSSIIGHDMLDATIDSSTKSKSKAKKFSVSSLKSPTGFLEPRAPQSRKKSIIESLRFAVGGGALSASTEVPATEHLRAIASQEASRFGQGPALGADQAQSSGGKNLKALRQNFFLKLNQLTAKSANLGSSNKRASKPRRLSRHVTPPGKSSPLSSYEVSVDLATTSAQPSAEYNQGENTIVDYDDLRAEASSSEARPSARQADHGKLAAEVDACSSSILSQPELIGPNGVKSAQARQASIPRSGTVVSGGLATPNMPYSSSNLGPVSTSGTGTATVTNLSSPSKQGRVTSKSTGAPAAARRGYLPSDAERHKRKLAKARERRATLILGLIMTAFICSWLPFFTFYVLRALCNICRDYISPRFEAFIFWMGYCNSAINPIIYTIFNRDFRKAFRKILFKCF